MNVRLRQAVSVLQASQSNPVLSQLMARQDQSVRRLEAVSTLIPAGIRAQVQAGSFEEGQWCLLLDNPASAAKMRQLLPDLQAHLHRVNLEVKAIRLKVRGR